MSIAAALAELQPSKQGLPCSIHSILKGMNAEDAAALQAALDVGPGQVGRLTSQQICGVLQDANIPVMKSALERHRRRQCRCFGAGNPE